LLEERAAAVALEAVVADVLDVHTDLGGVAAEGVEDHGRDALTLEAIHLVVGEEAATVAVVPGAHRAAVEGRGRVETTVGQDVVVDGVGGADELAQVVERNLPTELEDRLTGV